MNIRKVHNDRFDSKKAALIGLKPDLKVSLMPSDLAILDKNMKWTVEPGAFTFRIGSSSEDIRLTKTVHLLEKCNGNGNL